MSDDVNIFDWQVAAAAETGAEGVWLKLLPKGTFKLRDGRGPFLADDLHAIVDRTLQHAATTELMVDYDHQAAFSAVPGVGGRAEAAGWIKKFEVRADGIYGLVQWTGEAAGKIAAQTYRYISPLFTSAKSGRVGKLLNVALVNMPALDLAAVAASNLHLTEREPEDMNSIAKALGLADSASSDAILAALNDRHSKIAAAVGLKADAAFTDIVSAAAAAIAALGTVAQAAGLQAGAGVDDVVAAMAKNAPMSLVASLQTEVKSLRETLEGKGVEDIVSAALKGGKIAPAQEAWARNYAKADLAGFSAFVENQPQLTKVQLGDREIPANQALDANAIAAAAQLYQDEQAKLGRTVTMADAVTHVEAEQAKAKK